MPHTPGQIVVVIFFLLATGCGSKQEKVKPVVEDISESVFASGIVKSNNQYEVYSSVNGLIEEIFVSEGSIVKKGQPILRLSNTASRLNRENAALAAAYADLKANAERLNEARVETDLAKSKVVNDSLLMVRQENLHKLNVGTQIEWEQRQLAYKNSVTAWKASVIRYKELERQLKFIDTQSRKSLEISSTQVNDFTVVSAIDGKVYRLFRKTGEMANPSTPLAVLGESEKFILELEVDENDISSILKGQQVLLTMDSYPNQVFEATVDRIYPMMNERTQSFKIEALFSKKPPTLYPNLTVEANIILRTKKNALTIPRTYLVDDSLVIKSDRKKYKVVTGLKDYVKVEILQGLGAGDEIVMPEP